MKKILFLLSVTLLCSAPLSYAASGDQTHNKKQTGDDFRILYHERMKPMEFYVAPQTQQDGSSAQANDTRPTVLSFDAFGQHFDLILEPNSGLQANLPEKQKLRLQQSVRFYKGYIDGIEDSWVRINRFEEKISGMIWDGIELYVIDTSDEVAPAIQDAPESQTQTKPYSLIYRLSDTESPSATCGLDPDAKSIDGYEEMIGELQELVQTLPAAGATKRLEVAIVADAQFVQANNSNPDSAVLARMNVVDGIYSNQLGVELNVVEIRSMRSNGSLTSNSAQTLLGQFRSFASSTGFNNPGLAHLFTGRDLDGSTVGGAFIDVLCSSSSGVGLSQTRGTGTAGALTITHELGHNFGAPHDNQSGSICASEPGNFIMNPRLNGSDRFSQCSLEQMRPRVNNAACISNLPTPNDPIADVRVTLPVNPINTKVSASFNYRVEVRNRGSIAARDTTARISIPNALTINQINGNSGNCTDNGAAVDCNFGNVGAGATRVITLNMRADATPQSVVSNVQVTASNDSNSGNNTAQAKINIRDQDSTSLIFRVGFNSGTGGFRFVDDPFRGTKQPKYASGKRIVNQNNNGKLRVFVGGRDKQLVRRMSGGWRRSFSLNDASNVKLSLVYQLAQNANYEADEFSDALLTVDGKLIGAKGGDFLSRLVGDGNGGATKGTGNQKFQIDLGRLSAGKHTITIGAFNNKKSYSNEVTRLAIDKVEVETIP